MRALRVGIGFLVVVLATGGCALFGEAERSTPRLVVPEEEYRIGIEDSLQITVWKNEALSRAATVRPDGKISLPLLNDVQAAGLTTTELKESLQKKFSEFIPTPEVYITVGGIRGFDVNVLGDGAKAGRYTLKRPTTVEELIAQIGGLTQFAYKSRIVILRQEGNVTRRIPYNYNKVIRGEVPDMQLKPDDLLIIP
jgi:polysaccharide export outer membrane protein